jgi:hypothetical protein
MIKKNKRENMNNNIKTILNWPSQLNKPTPPLQRFSFLGSTWKSYCVDGSQDNGIWTDEIALVHSKLWHSKKEICRITEITIRDGFFQERMLEMDRAIYDLILQLERQQWKSAASFLPSLSSSSSVGEPLKKLLQQMHEKHFTYHPPAPLSNEISPTSSVDSEISYMQAIAFHEILEVVKMLPMGGAKFSNPKEPDALMKIQEITHLMMETYERTDAAAVQKATEHLTEACRTYDAPHVKRR